MLKKLLVVAIGASFAISAQAAKLQISCGAVGQELELCKKGAEEWAKKTGNEVAVVPTPNDSSERLALYQQLLSSGTGTLDVMQIDVVWPSLLASHLVDLKPFTKGAEKAHFPAMVANNTVGGKLVAMPWFTDAGLLYYRKDMLEKYHAKVPTTWQELTATAKLVQDGERKAGNDKFWGYVWQGRAYEGLTCDALEWVASNGGGNIVEPNGKISIDNPKAAAALTLAASWVDTISPKGVLNYGEEDARGVFQTGNAVFMRNWPYAWNLAQQPDSAVKGKVGVAALPRGEGGKSAATMGGWQLAVSKYSKNQKLAADLVMYLTGPEVQKDRAIVGSFNPTISALYKDAAVVKANPFMGDLLPVFVGATARPATVTGDKYNQVSTAFWNASYNVLSGKEKAPESLKKLAGDLNRLSRGGKW